MSRPHLSLSPRASGPRPMPPSACSPVGHPPFGGHQGQFRLVRPHDPGRVPGLAVLRHQLELVDAVLADPAPAPAPLPPPDDPPHPPALPLVAPLALDVPEPLPIPPPLPAEPVARV